MRLSASLPLAAAVFAAVAPRAALAAHITNVADAADKDTLLDVDVDVGFRHVVRSAKVTREYHQKCGVAPYPDCPTGAPANNNGEPLDITELNYQDVLNALDFRVAFGLWHDLEIHGGIPLVLSQNRSWTFGSVPDARTGASSAVTADQSTFVGLQHLDPSGVYHDNMSMPMLSVPGNSYRAGFMDPYIGIAWGPFNDDREAKMSPDAFPNFRSSSTWVIGADYTMPILTVDDPSLWGMANTSGDAAAAQSRWNAISSSGASGLGRGAHILELWTAVSKRVGLADPFMKLHFTWPIGLTGNAYDNCSFLKNHPDVQTANPQLSDQAANNCASPNGAGAGGWSAANTSFDPSYVGGMLLGTELVPFEDEERHQKIAFDLRFGVDFISKGRNYSELSDGLGRLTATDQYVSMTGSLGFYARPTRFMHIRLGASYGFETPHFVTGESPGHDLNNNGAVDLGGPEQNPIYDFRVDAVGTRARVEQVTVFGLNATIAGNF